MSLANSHYFKDTAAMLGRSLKHIARSADTIITVCLVPIAIMLMFVYVFGGALGDGMNTSEYVDYALPGILLISIASASAYTAARMFADKESGFFSRLRSMPIPTSSALWAHMLTSLLSNALSLAIISWLPRSWAFDRRRASQAGLPLPAFLHCSPLRLAGLPPSQG